MAASPIAFDPGSYRDPDTRVFRHQGAIYRCLSRRALLDWDHLRSTRFFERFTRDGALVETEQLQDLTTLPALGARWAAVLRHEKVPFVSYPYEWPFSMLKDAALLQLDLTLAALEEGMILKDATPYNSQWVGSTPTFIDIGSFARYEDGNPWDGYRQFCSQFLYPLILQAYKGVPYHAWLRGSLEGIDAEDCRSLLSARDYVRPGVLSHVYLQAKAQSRFQYSNRSVRSDLRAAGFGAAMIVNNVKGLRRTIEGLVWSPSKSTWSDYSTEHSYSEGDLQRKSDFVGRVLARRRWSIVWDIGCNTGTYSRLAADHADYVVALDGDHLAVDRMYAELGREKRSTVLPLLMDFANPSPDLGWRGRERRSLAQRGSPELILCLALMHHLVIGRNIPLREFVEWLASLGGDVVLEFVGRQDPMVGRLLQNRGEFDISYSREELEFALEDHYHSVTHETLQSSDRTLYYARTKI